MILVDTNLLLRAIIRDDQPHQIAIEAIKNARSRGYEPCVVAQVLYEFWVVVTRPASDNGFGMDIEDAKTNVDAIVAQFRLLPSDENLYGEWLTLVVENRVHGKQAHDARLVAAMSLHGVRHLLTFNDKHFQRFDQITAVHPGSVDQLTLLS